MTAKVSYLLLAYNSGATIREALESVLSQEGEPIEVVVSDDCSTDQTFEIVREIKSSYRGHHDLRVHRQSANLGLLGNLIAAANASDGEFLVLGAGDDRAQPHRVSRLLRAWTQAGAPAATYAYSDVRPIDASGSPVQNWPERVARPPWSMLKLAGGSTGPLGAGSAITRDLLLSLGPLRTTIRHEDRVLPFRALLSGGMILFVDEPLVDYRIEGGISRMAPASRYVELTTNARRHYQNVLPDAEQRTVDAIAARAPAAVIRRCKAVLTEQKTMLAMSDGRNLTSKALAGIRGGGRPAILFKHLARFILARAMALLRPDLS